MTFDSASVGTWSPLLSPQLGWACSPGQLLKISLELAAGEAWLWYRTTRHPRPAEAMQGYLCNSLQVSLNRMNTVKLSGSHLSGHQRTLKFLQGSLAWARGWHVIQFGGNFNLRALKRPVGKQGGFPPSLTPKKLLLKMSSSTYDRGLWQ